MEMTLIGLLYLIVLIFFCFSMFKALQALPAKYHRFPAWFVWLILVPVAGIVFVWIMLPFGIPKAFKHFSDHEKPEAMADCKVIFGLGLAYAILITACMLPFLSLFAFVASFVTLVIYWSQVVSFRKRYLKQNEFKQPNVKSEKSE